MLWALLLQMAAKNNNILIAPVLLTLLGVGAWLYSKKRMNSKLSKNFSLEEFASKDGATTPAEVIDNLRELAKNLQVLRDYVAKPIKISSGYRSPEHNKSVGGVANSQHVKGKAADIKIDGMTPAQVADTIESFIQAGKMKQGGIGIYPNFVHYDTRGKKARW